MAFVLIVGLIISHRLIGDTYNYIKEFHA